MKARGPRIDRSLATNGDSADPQDAQRRPVADDPLSARNVVLVITGLFALGIARPLLELLGQNVQFFVAHGASPIEIALFAIGTAIVVPAVLGLIVAGVVAVHRATGAALLAVAMWALTALAVLAAFRVSDADGAVPGWLTMGIALAVGAAVTVFHQRSARVRLVLRLAAIAAPVAALIFLFATPANRLLMPAANADSGVSVGSDAPPIVMVVFDEFPVASILDAKGEVDATAFPSFDRLAKSSTFFNNATTVHARTVDSIPAIVSGRRLPREGLPTVADNPTSLMNLLKDDYELRAIEPVTALCPRDVCRGGVDAIPGSEQRASLVRDLGIIEAHLVVPVDWAGGLPPLDAGWRDFAATGETAAPPDSKSEPKSWKDFLRQGDGRRDKWPGVFRHFVADVRASEQPTLHFLHVAFPHYPWMYFPDGRQYQPAPTGTSGLEGIYGIEEKWWRGSEWQVSQGQQRHLLQVQYADHLTGLLIDKLESEGMYDESLVIVVADHGASFKRGTHLRAIFDDNFHEIAGVPLFIKAPGQQQGATSNQPVETVDIVPTVLDLLDVPAPDNLDGMSVYDPALARRSRKRVSELIRYVTIDFDPDDAGMRTAVARKLGRFGVDGHLDPFALAPEGTRHLLGQPASESVEAAATGTVRIDNAATYERVDLEAPIMPALLSGSFADDGRSEAPVLAISVNGTIEAVTMVDPPGSDGSSAFRALLPPDSLRQGKNDINVFVVEPDGGLLSVATSGPE